MPRPLLIWDDDERILTMTPEEDLKLIREIIQHGGHKYTAGNIDRTKYQRLVDLGWLLPLVQNKTDISYEVTREGLAAAS